MQFKVKAKVYFIFFLFIFFFYPGKIFSQNRDTVPNISTNIEKIIQDRDKYFFADSVSRSNQYYYHKNMRNKKVRMYGTFLPVIFDGKLADDLSFSLPSPFPEKKIFPILTYFPLPFQDEIEERKFFRRTYDYIITHHVPLVKYSVENFPKEVEQITELESNIFQNLFKIDYDIDNEKKVDMIHKFVPKRRYWTTTGNSLIQFSQNYISDNWHKGGSKNLNLLSVQNMSAKYQKDKITFNTAFEWKLSLFTNSNDTLRDLRIGDDLIRSYSDFGIQAFNKRWSYSTNIEIKTQIFKNFKENEKNLLSSFASPLMINMGIFGMKYQLNKSYEKDKYKKLSVQTDISPLSIQYIYVANKNVDPGRFGIEEGKRHKLDVGSSINSTFNMNFNKNISFTSRFRYFTNYENVVIESENTLNMPINRYFSTRVYAYLRFDDDSNLEKGKWDYFQINELVSFGFNYKW